MQSLPKFNQQLPLKLRDIKEHGAAMIMMYLAILMFLFLAILFLDIPYMERVGRTVQRAADAASLAGVVQLTRHNDPSFSVKLQSWRSAKRAAIAMLKESTIAGIPSSIFAGLPGTYSASTGGTGTQDLLDATSYGYQTFNISNGTQTGSITIKRGVYQRPAPWDPNLGQQRPQIFYPIELGDPNRGAAGGLDQYNCFANVSTGNLPTACLPAASIMSNAYTFCTPIVATACQLNSALFINGSVPVGTVPAYTSSAAGYPRVDFVADSMQVTVTVNGIPTLFAKLLGFNSFVSLTRTSTSGPM